MSAFRDITFLAAGPASERSRLAARGEMMDDEAEILSVIRRHVWAGTYDAEEIAIIVGEEFYPPGQAHDDWLRARIDEELRLKRAEEATWSAVTDCDRIDQVFETLQTQGIIVEQHAGLTKSDGLEIVTETYEDAQADGEAEGLVGYCFYHGQDLEHVMENGDLWLAFGHFSGKKKPAVDIGQRIKRALEAAGFAVEWDGSIGTRLLVKGLRWQRRSP